MEVDNTSSKELTEMKHKRNQIQVKVKAFSIEISVLKEKSITLQADIIDLMKQRKDFEQKIRELTYQLESQRKDFEYQLKELK